MKNNLRGKIRDFLASEEGRVGAKSPLTLGVASASVLLAHTMVAPSVQADIACNPEDPDACGETMVCKEWCAHWDFGTCLQWEAHCEFP